MIACERQYHRLSKCIKIQSLAYISIDLNNLVLTTKREKTMKGTCQGSPENFSNGYQDYEVE